MSFTYSVSTDIGQVRLEIGDTLEGEGVLPNDANLTDAEIQVYLTREVSVLAAAAAACEMLSRAWAKMSSSLSTSNRSEAFNQSKQFADSAAALRARVRATSGGGVVSVRMTRGDGIT